MLIAWWIFTTLLIKLAGENGSHLWVLTIAEGNAVSPVLGSNLLFKIHLMWFNIFFQTQHLACANQNSKCELEYPVVLVRFHHLFMTYCDSCFIGETWNEILSKDNDKNNGSILNVTVKRRKVNDRKECSGELWILF